MGERIRIVKEHNSLQIHEEVTGDALIHRLRRVWYGSEELNAWLQFRQEIYL